ncbi:hypothetical protein BGZ75_000301 [Mortierella antarctica]|nr:hypothetical protein BGZ75_000301 [Mortierella antarctica]
MKTDFPEYTAYKFNSGADVDTEQMLQNLSLSEYRDALSRTDFLIQRQLGKAPHSCVFQVIDTPGIAEDTASNDEKIVTSIAAALSVVESIHLVIVAVSEDSCVTPSLKQVLIVYNTISPAMGGLIAFVHTKVEFWRQHPHDKTICDRIRYLEECIHKHDSEDLDFVCETGFQEEAGALGSLFSRQERKFEALLDHCIDALRVDFTGIILIETSGGEGHRYWISRVRSMNGKGARFHARLYTKRCTIRHNDLTKWGSELEQYRRRLKERVSAQSLFGPLVSLEDNALQLQQRELMATHTRYLDMKSFASQPTLDLRLFAAVANGRIYERNTQPQECVQRAVAFFSTYTLASRAQ